MNPLSAIVEEVCWDVFLFATFFWNTEGDPKYQHFSWQGPTNFNRLWAQPVLHNLWTQKRTNASA